MIKETPYPSIYNLAHDGNNYLLSQNAIAHYLGVSRQSVNKKLALSPLRTKYVIAKKLQNTFGGKQKLVPIRYYNLDVLKELAYLTQSDEAPTVAAILEESRANRKDLDVIQNKPLDEVYLS